MTVEHYLRLCFAGDLGDSVGLMKREGLSGSLHGSRLTSSKKLGPQSYNHKEMNSTNNLSESESNSSPVESLGEDGTGTTQLDFHLVRP